MFEIYEGYFYRTKEDFEIACIQEVSHKLFGLFSDELEKLKDNQFILTATEEGIAQREREFAIIPNLAKEDLAFRRQRVLNRNTTKPPYTLEYLVLKLDDLLGAGNYEVLIDYPTYTAHVECSIASAEWFIEISGMIGKMKPANLVYMNKPRLSHGVGISETVDYKTMAYNYRLGTKWMLGQKPFVTFEGGGIIKGAETRSITGQLLADIALFSIEDITQVRINGTLLLTDFVAKTASGNEGSVEYQVKPEQTAEITKIELLNATDQVLESAVVFVPVTDPVQVKHKFLIKEGA